MINNCKDLISVRIDKNLKEKAKELGINIKDVVERALKEEIEKRRKEKIKKLAEKLSELMKNVSPEDMKDNTFLFDNIII